MRSMNDASRWWTVNAFLAVITCAGAAGAPLACTAGDAGEAAPPGAGDPSNAPPPIDGGSVGHLDAAGPGETVDAAPRADSDASPSLDGAATPDASGSTHGPRPYANSSPWNTPVPATATWHDEPVLHNLPSLAGTSDTKTHWYAWSNVAEVTAQVTDPLWSIDVPEFRGRKAQTLHVHGPENLDHGSNPDQTLSLIDGTTAYDFWFFARTPDAGPHTATVAAWGEDDVVTGTGFGKGDGLTSGQGAGVRACNSQWMGGLITQADLAAGVIDHAITAALTGEMLMNAMVPPVNYYDNGGNYGPIPSGARIGIPAGAVKPAGLSAIGEMVYAAIAKYGIYVVDHVGGQWPAIVAQEGIPDATIQPLYVFWAGTPSDMDRIGPLLRIVDYPTPQR